MVRFVEAPRHRLGLLVVAARRAARLSGLLKLRKSEAGAFFFGKRTKIAICSSLVAILSWFNLFLTGTTFFYLFVLSLAVIAAFILWVLSEDLAGVKFFTIPALPIFYLGSYLLLADLLNLTAVGVFVAGLVLGISFYILLLTQNIYNIASVRSIGLVRAAAVSGTLFIIICAFLAYGIVWLQNWPFWYLTPAILLISFVLFTIAIWSHHLDEKIDNKTVMFSAILALVLAQIATALSFWPLLPLISALVLAIVFYVVLGLTQFELQQRLTARVVYEYLSIAAVVLVLILVTTRWGG